MTAKVPLKVHLRLRFQNLGKPRTAGLCGRAAGACDCGPLSCAFIERPSPLRKPSCKVRLFAQNRSRKYRPKVAVATLLQTAFHRVFQLLSQTAHVRFLGRKCTHSPLLKGSHTAAYTAKQGPSGRGSYHYPRHVLHVYEHPRAGYQSGVLCRFWVLARGCSRRTQRAFGAAMRSCASLFRGVAAPLGCVIFFCFCQNCGLHTMCSVLSACARRGVVSPLLVCSACCRNSRPPLVKTTNLPFSEIG